ncbi:MAG: DNA (cytosine-5-)-methyltransferase [Paraclostridium sordellii]
MRQKLRLLSLFSGAGGMDVGFIKAGFDVVFANDSDKNAVNTYKKNIGNHIVEEDIKNLDEQNIPSNIDIVIGGPPCQGFSMAGNIGRRFIDDDRNYLFKEFSRVISIANPKFFVMENVARLYTHNKNNTRNEIIKEFNEIGYKVECKILNSADYGVAQIRRRIIFIGVRSDIDVEISFPEPIYNDLNYRTVRDAIGDLPKLKSGESNEKYLNHESMNHTESMLEKMSYVCDGGNRSQIPEELRPKSGDIRKYIRYNSSKPSVCITGDMRKVFHYEQNRALTVRELARIQSFDDDFEFMGPKISQQQQVGNAVPPMMAYAIAQEILKMNENLESRTVENMSKKNKIISQEQLNLFNNTDKVIEKSIIDVQLPKINYIGNKEKLTGWIIENIPDDVTSVFDAFSGGCSVSFELKKLGYRVFTNDILKINYTLAKSIIENKSEVLNKEDLDILFKGMPVKGYMTNKYSNKFYFENECMELDLYRKNIEKLCNEYKKSIAYSLIRRAMIRKMPYSRFTIPWDKIVQLRDEKYSYEKYGRKRAYHNQSFKSHILSNLDDYNKAIFDNGKDNKAYNEDIFNIINDIDADLIYLDPPYTGTMNDYFKFYGILDEYIDQKEKEEFKNNFRNKLDTIELFEKLFKNINKYKYALLSYNNNAYPDKETMIKLILKYNKNVKVIERNHNYKITGKEMKNKNKEILFLITT